MFFIPLKRTDMDAFTPTPEERNAYLEHRVSQLSENVEKLNEQVWTLEKRLDRTGSDFEQLRKEAERDRKAWQETHEQSQKEIDKLGQKLEETTRHIDMLQRVERIALRDCIRILEKYPPEQNAVVSEIIGFLHKSFKKETPEEHERLSQLDLKPAGCAVQFNAPVYDVNGNGRVQIGSQMNNEK